MRYAPLALLVVVVACSAAPATSTQYLLRADPVDGGGRIQVPVRVGLGRVVVAPYLDQSGIVVQTAAGQVQAARQHEWAEPLDDGLRSFLRAVMSESLDYDVGAGPVDPDRWDYVVDVGVDQLHGTIDGTAVLDGSYRITRTRGNDIVEFRFSRSAPLPREGYPGFSAVFRDPNGNHVGLWSAT